jgi:hypothetical protein
MPKISPWPSGNKRTGYVVILFVAALLFLTIGILIGRGSFPAESETPQGQPLVAAENDIACLDKEFVRAAAKQPLLWKEQDGRMKYFYTHPFFDVNRKLFFDYDEMKACIRLIEFSPFGAYPPDFYKLKVPAKLTIVKRDGDIACVVGNPIPPWLTPMPGYRPPPKGQCYWMILRPPSERAGPKPN